MRLKNKRTGEIKELQNIISDMIANHIVPTLIAIENEWEDVPEEPKEDYWYITEDGTLGRINLSWDTQESIENHKSIGNYFETYEEAEKAVEKLKAVKRLKDKGFVFTGIAGVSNTIYVSFETDNKYDGGHIMYDEYSNTDNKLREYNEDLTLLFGGEE